MDEKLSPSAKERIAKIMEKLTSEEKKKIQISEKTKSLFSGFYQGSLDSEGLWKRLKEFPGQDRECILREIQLNLIETMSLGISKEEFQKRVEGILSAEVLKREKNTSVIESRLNSIKFLQKRYKEERGSAYQNLKTEIESNPELGVKSIQKGNTTVVMELSVDEAVKQSEEWKNFISEHNQRYHRKFIEVIEKFKKEVKKNL